MAADDEAPRLYPARYWGLDPIFSTHIKLFVRDLLVLPQFEDYKDVHCLGNHPISRVEIMGYIVSVDIKEKLATYGVDDGTGTIPCCCWRQGTHDSDQVLFEHGQLVTIQGKISTFREQRQVTASLIIVEKDVNSEVLFWLEVIHLHKTIYKEPFHLQMSLLEDFECSSSRSKYDQLRKSILDFITETNTIAFRFQSICSEPSIHECARNIFQEERKEANGSRGIETIVRQNLKKLVREGHLHHKDPQADLYEVISHQHNLGGAILKAMEQVSNGSHGTGVSVRKILNVIRASHEFSHVTYQKVEDSLHRLLESSDVYKQSNYEYCLV